MRSLLLSFCLLLVPAATLWSAPRPGDQVENLTFKDIRYLPRTLDDLGKADAYVLFFFTNTCPLAQRYMPRVNTMYERYREHGVVFLGINAGPDDTILEVARHAIEYGAEYPLVKDMTGDCARALGVTRTPEVAVLDADRVLRYRGRIDDQYRLGGVRPEASRADLEAALDDVLGGDPVRVPETKPEGCVLTFPHVPEPEAPVSYAEHIAPIINANCVVCHRPGGGAPFALDNYRRVAARAGMIAEVVSEERMPPWYAHPEWGTFANDRRLRDEEKLAILQWVASGKRPGELEQAPDAPRFPDTDWQIEPDVIIEAGQEFELPATGFVPYQYVFLPYEFERDTWVQGIEVSNTNPAVLHHANLFFKPPEGRFDKDQHFLTGKVPGGRPAELGEHSAIRIPKGAVLGLQIHYVTTGKPETARILVGLRFAKEPVHKRVYYKILEGKDFAIEPHASAHRVVSEDTLEADATVIALFSHMHLRGRGMDFVAHLPGGVSETLLSIPNFSFDWQLAYYVEPGTMKLPKGARLEAIAYYDNSAFNPYNPDPTATVRYGPQTVDEMMNGFIFYTRDDERLDLRVDPETGWELTEVARADN